MFANDHKILYNQIRIYTIMIIKKVTYKGKEYSVYNPGEILFGRNKRILLDQLLDGVTPIPRRREGGINPYLIEKYNLTQNEYHFIVVHSADESNIPKCPICGEVRKMISIVKGYDSTCGCTKCVMSLRKLTKKKSGGSYERNHELRSSISRRTCLKQIENGTHNFQNSDGSWKSKEVQDDLVRQNKHHWQSCNGYSDIAKERNKKWNELGVNPFQSNFVTLESCRIRFINKGNVTDKCYFYEARIPENDCVFKIGVTSDLEHRKNFMGEKCYSEITEVYSATRTEIAELEYQVKLKFYGKAVIGTETFPIEMRDEILSYAKSLYNK